MRDITVTRLEFDEFLWPIVTNSQAENEKERSVAVDVLRLLSDDDCTEEVPLTDEQIEKAERSNSHVWNSRRLSDDEHTFAIEEAPYRLVRKRMKDAISKVSIICMDDFSPLVDKINDAKKYTAKVVPDETAEARVEPTPEGQERTA